METKLQVRLSKSGSILFKGKVYQVKVNGKLVGEIHEKNHKIVKPLPAGKYTVEVGEKDFLEKKEIILNLGYLQTFTINPGATVRFIKGLLIGMGITALAIQFFLMKEISLLMLIPFIPFLMLRKSNLGENFSLTISRTKL